MTTETTRSKKWLWFSGVGAALTALCCFTPLAIIALGAVGASALAVYLDMVLIPLLFFFLVVFTVSLLRLAGRKRAGPWTV